MSNVGRKGRSFKRISDRDLRRLATIAALDRHDFFNRHPRWALEYKDRFLCSALCQGAALHYLNGRTGINDFDVYSFYAANPRRAWYAKALRSRDFGNPRFGQTVSKPEYVGRRVDLMGRSIEVARKADPVTAIRQYLQRSRTRSARLLAEKAVVILQPARLRGTVVWPVTNRTKAV